ncbi:hypothetical protein B5M09_007964 [Aphanomyces astaci]|uniref:STAS domain-containing protein n=1 Tax=Aphanomyces astaci TaxID=112090 RepID=A0A425DH77_APHAT|nr:hypothetical protein B5M09_007964 [Aphanomyces astaci]
MPLTGHKPSKLETARLEAQPIQRLIVSTRLVVDGQQVTLHLTSLSMHLFSKPSRSWVAHLAWLPQYNFRRDFKFDFIAGITVAMMIVPQEISLANIMHVPPQYGLYTAALTPVLYALFGSSRVLSVANGAEVSLMVGAALQNIKTDQERVAVGIFLSFYIGLINLTLGCLQLGVIADFFSRPVMGGFLSGGGVLIMISQLGSWFQLTLPSTSYPLETVVNLCRQIRDCNTNSVVVGAVSIVVLSVMKYAKQHWIPAPKVSHLFESTRNIKCTRAGESLVSLTEEPDAPAQLPAWGFSLNDDDFVSLDEQAPAKPPICSNKRRNVLLFLLRTCCDLGPLVVCLIGIVVGQFLGESEVKVIGHVPRGVPAPVLPWYGYATGIIQSVDFTTLTVHALSMALIVYMTSIAMTKRLALRVHSDVNSSQELIGLGMASALGAFFQVMPPTGGMSRTAVNMQVARTQLASTVTSLLVVLMLMVGMDALYFLPKASLAAVIIVAGFYLVEIHEATWLFHSKRDEFFVWLASFAATIGMGILPGLGVSILCSLVALMIQTKRPLVYALGRSRSSGAYVNTRENADAIVDADIVVVRVQGSLYFGNTDYAMQRILSLHHDVATAVVLDATYIHDMDATTLGGLEMLHMKLAQRGVHFAVANGQPRLANILQTSGVCAKLSLADVTSSVDATMARLRATVVAVAAGV